MNERLAGELSRLSRVVGKEGKLSQRAVMPEVSGFWRESVESVNELIGDLVHPTTETARVIGAVAQGDLSQTMALEADGRPLQGEFRRTAKTINKMVDQLGSFASEVTRVAREVGTDGTLSPSSAWRVDPQHPRLIAMHLHRRQRLSHARSLRADARFDVEHGAMPIAND